MLFSKSQLLELSQKLLELHRALLQYERKNYEERFGKVGSPGKFLDLLMTDAHFAWLRELSGLIVGIDELADSKEPAAGKQISDLITYTKSLLSGSKEGNRFAQNYLAALQKDPHVAVCHGQVMQLLKNV